MIYAHGTIKFSKMISVDKMDELFSMLANDWYREGNDSTEYESVGIESGITGQSVEDDCQLIRQFAKQNNVSLKGNIEFIDTDNTYIIFDKSVMTIKHYDN